MSRGLKNRQRPTIGGPLASARAIAADRRGVAAIELAILAPTLLFLLMGLFDVGQMTYTAMQVRAAAHAGAQYVYFTANNSQPCSTSGIQTAVEQATPLNVSTTNATSCGVKACVTNNVLVATTGSTCPSGDPPGIYAEISASAAFTPVAPWSTLVLPTTITATSEIRYQ